MSDKADLQLCDLFEVEYGNKFDLKQMQLTTASDPDGVSFVSRSRENLGVAAYVKPYRRRWWWQAAPGNIRHPFRLRLNSLLNSIENWLQTQSSDQRIAPTQLI